MAHYLLDEFKIYKDINSDNLDEDTLLNSLLTQVEAFLNNTYNIYLAQKSIEKTFDISIKNYIVLRGNNISLTQIVMNNVTYTENDATYDLNDFYIDGCLLKHITALFPLGKRKVTVNYTVGYQDITTIDMDLKLIFFMLVDIFYEKIKNNGNLVNTYSDPVGGRMKFNNDIPKELILMLQPYRCWAI